MATNPPAVPIVEQIEIAEDRFVIYEDPTEYRETSLYCSCILTARHLGAPLPKGDAEDLPVNASMTDVGVKAVKLKYEDIYHVAVIQDFTSEGLHIAEGNKERCKYTERVIPYDSPEILGYWKPS